MYLCKSQTDRLSRTFRSIVLAQAETTRTAADVARLTQIVPLNGTFWGSRTLEDLQNRATNAMKYFRGDFTPQRDAPDTIREFRRIFMSVEGILRTPPLSTMHPESKTGMVQLLTYILDIIPYTHQDMARVGQQTPVYASGQSEYNLFQRFASSRDDWSACLEAIRRLIALDANLFNADARGNLRNANQRLDYNRASGYASNQSAVDFIARFKLIIQGLPGGEYSSPCSETCHLLTTLSCSRLNARALHDSNRSMCDPQRWANNFSSHAASFSGWLFFFVVGNTPVGGRHLQPPPHGIFILISTKHFPLLHHSFDMSIG